MNHEEKIAEMETAIAADYSNIAGMVVLKDGKAVYESLPILSLQQRTELNLSDSMSNQLFYEESVK